MTISKEEVARPSRELVHVYGVGINSQYHVMENGRQIGWIGRKLTLGFEVEALYGRVLLRRVKLDQARKDALLAEFPTETEAWQAHWEETFAKRKRVLQRAFAERIAGLAAQVLDGSNSARVELTDLFTEIDRDAADPAKTQGYGAGYFPRFAKRKDWALLEQEHQQS